MRKSTFIADMQLTYKMYQDTTLQLIGKQSIGPTGSLFETSTLRAQLTKTINAHESITFATDANRITQAGTTTDFASASVNYHVSLTHEWSAGLTYRFLHRFGTSEPTAAAIDLTGIPVINPLGRPIPTASWLSSAARPIFCLTEIPSALETSRLICRSEADIESVALGPRA
jgi:hypothetical protein